MIRAKSSSGAVGVTVGNALMGTNSIGSEIHLEMNSYTHKRTANGGFWDAQVSLAGNISALLPSINSIIGLNVETVSESGKIIWNGFVNQINIETGIGTFSVGPLMGVRNNLSVIFQTARYNTIPPIGGQRRRLPPLSDLASQERYGIIGHELSGGTGDTSGALNLQQTHLKENKAPRVTQSIRVGSSSSTSYSISLQCLGYVQLLDKFIYEANVAGNTIPETKIKNILQAEPNGLFGTLYAPDANTISVPNFQESGSSWAAIKSMVALGDTNFDRYLFSVGENREGTYRKIPDSYRYSLEAGGIIEDDVGIVKSWDLEPGYWVDASSLMTGEPVSGDIGTNTSDIFIESVTYNAPDNAGIDGGRVDRSVQQLAQRGVGGSF